MYVSKGANPFQWSNSNHAVIPFVPLAPTDLIGRIIKSLSLNMAEEEEDNFLKSEQAKYRLHQPRCNYVSIEK